MTEGWIEIYDADGIDSKFKKFFHEYFNYVTEKKMFNKRIYIVYGDTERRLISDDRDYATEEMFAQYLIGDWSLWSE
jgi:hypothetical protein